MAVAAYLYDLLGEPVPYERAVALQRDLAAARSQAAIPDTLLLLEHPPTLTIGRTTRREEELPLGVDAYRELGWDVAETDRGGRATFHGPGQLVVWPILDLRGHGQDLHRYVACLQRAIVLALADLGVEAHVRDGADHVGAWVGDRKIASIGIAARAWIVTHGLALNVDPDLGAFDRFTPCGLQGTRFTSVAAELGRPAAVAEARAPLVARLAEVLDLVVEPVPVAAPA